VPTNSAINWSRLVSGHASVEWVIDADNARSPSPMMRMGLGGLRPRPGAAVDVDVQPSTAIDLPLHAKGYAKIE